MSLREEIELNRPFESKQEQALLSVMWTHRQLIKLSVDFFKAHDLTDTQFNALMIIADYQAEGIRQFELARRLLINRASVGTLISVMTEKGWIARQRVETDKRAYELILTPSGRALLDAFKPQYYALVRQSFAGLSDAEIVQLTALLARFRAGFLAALADAGEPSG